MLYCSAPHWVGIVKNGLVPPPDGHGVVPPGHVRTLSWPGSPGTPHSVSVLPNSGSSVDVLVSPAVRP